jgi:hypothetical protein
MKKKYAISSTLLLALGILGSSTSAQVPTSIDKSSQEISFRPEVRAVVDACREKGRQADTRHTLMVFRAAQEILKIKASFPEIAAADPMTAEVAAMLHDIGGGGLANAMPGSIIAREVLTSLKESQNFPDALVDKVSRIVETHHITGTVKGKDDGPEWYVVLLADTPKIYSASAADREAYARLIRERIDALKAVIQ